MFHFEKMNFLLDQVDTNRSVSNDVLNQVSQYRDHDDDGGGDDDGDRVSVFALTILNRDCLNDPCFSLI